MYKLYNIYIYNIHENLRWMKRAFGHFVIVGNRCVSFQLSFSQKVILVNSNIGVTVLLAFLKHVICLERLSDKTRFEDFEALLEPSGSNMRR